MSDFRLAPIDFISKINTARRDAPDVEALRQQTILVDGMPFIAMVTLFVFVADDMTPDDGVTSVRPDIIPPSSPGRFRQTGFGVPLETHDRKPG